METIETSQQTKAPKIRSVAYPSYVIEACIAMTQKIDDEFTDVVYSPKENISKNLNMSGGALDRILSSCAQYGLLELKKTLGYKPTQLYKSIKRPLPNETEIDLKRQCLQKPELYKKLLNEFNGKKLPSESGLANILDRLYDVKGDAADKAAKVFLKNVSALELVGSDNFLNLEGGVIEVEEVSPNDETTQPESVEQPVSPQHPLLLINQPAPAPLTVAANEQQKKEIPVFLKNGREAKLFLPHDFTEEDLQKVVKVLKAYIDE